MPTGGSVINLYLPTVSKNFPPFVVILSFPNLFKGLFKIEPSMGFKYQITKVYRFEAGHRVWTQNLAEGRGSQLSGNACPPENKCRHLHGHSYVVEITIGSETLDADMVMDFYHLKSAVKELIDYKLDHSFIVDKNDPLFPQLEAMAKEFGLKLFVVDFVPTAERLAEFIYKYLKIKFEEANVKDVEVVSVTVWETATSKATYNE